MLEIGVEDGCRRDPPESLHRARMDAVRDRKINRGHPRIRRGPLPREDRRAGAWQPRRVHESVSVQGAVGRLRNELEHFPYRDIAHHLKTIDRYTSLAAAQMLEDGRRARVIDLAAQPPLAFLRNYILRGGVRDGTAGLIVSATNAYYVFLKLAKLWELQRTQTRGGAGRP